MKNTNKHAHKHQPSHAHTHTHRHTSYICIASHAELNTVAAPSLLWGQLYLESRQSDSRSRQRERDWNAGETREGGLVTWNQAVVEVATHSQACMHLSLRVCVCVCVYNPLSKLEFSKPICDRNVAELCISGVWAEGSTMPLVLRYWAWNAFET